jgi:hypothetical protein
MLEEVQAQQLGVSIDQTWMGALMFADDYVGICESADDLQVMIDALHAYARRYRFQANVEKCAVVEFGNPNLPTPVWNWGGEPIPVKPSYVYLGVLFANTCSWDAHGLNVVAAGSAKLDKLQHVFRNKHLSVSVKRTLLMSILKPVLAYAGEVWEPSVDVAKQLDNVFLQACKVILQTGERVSAEPVRADLGLLPLKAYRTISKLKFRHRVEGMPAHRLPRVAAMREWRSTQRGRQTQMWSQYTQKLKDKYIPAIDLRACSASHVSQAVEDAVMAHESLHLDITMRTKPKLHLLAEANEGIDFKPYLRGRLDFGTKLLFRFRAGHVALNGVLDNMADPSCPCCGSERETVAHTLIGCPTYQQHRQILFSELGSLLPNSSFTNFLSSSPEHQAMCIISGKYWPEQHRASICHMAKEFLCRMWKTRMQVVQGGGSLTVPDLANQPFGTASFGGAEAYGHLATAPNP